MRHTATRAPLGAVLLGLVLAACPAPPAQRSPVAFAQEAPRAAEQAARADVPAPPAVTIAAPPLPVPPASPRPRDAGVCAPSDENLGRAVRAILAQGAERGAAVPRRAWDHKSPPEHMARVAARFGLTASERGLLAKNGFVVVPSIPTNGYARAYHEVYQSQLPIYVSADSVFHAMFKTHEREVRELETGLAERERRALEAMHAGLAGLSRELPAEIADDVDLYLTVALALLDGKEPKTRRAPVAEAKSLVDRATAATSGLATVTLFGRARVIDFSQYRPRGHYAETEELSRYFRASMWLSRLELNLVSRASRSSQPGLTPNPEETPREAVTALALAELTARTGTLPDWDALERAWTEIAGHREDISPRVLSDLRAKMPRAPLSLTLSQPALGRVIGAGHARTTRVHYMPQGSTPLPVIFTMLGARIVKDATAASHLVHADVADRDAPGIADIALMLGHDHARRYLTRDLARYPELAGKLEAGRRTIAAAPATDMYGAWLGAIAALATPGKGVVPSFVETRAYADMRMSSIASAYGQLRHANMLFAGQAYSEGGCEVPDGYVEPAPHVWAALRTFAATSARAMHALGSPSGAARYARIDGILAVLETIAKDEVEGRSLTEAQRQFLSMVVEIVPPSSDGPGRFDGWYFDLFSGVDAAFEEHGFVADWFTGSNAREAVYAGATAPRFALFVVDTGGAPRVMVGAVARGFEARAPLAKRLTDEDAGKLRDVYEPWAASYTAPLATAPPLQVLPGPIDDDSAGITLALRSTHAIGAVTVELLDHHRERVGVTTVGVAAGTSLARVRVKPGASPEVIRIAHGAFRHEHWLWESRALSFGGMRELSWEEASAFRERLEKKARATSSPPRRGSSL